MQPRRLASYYCIPFFPLSEDPSVFIIIFVPFICGSSEGGRMLRASHCCIIYYLIRT